MRVLMIFVDGLGLGPPDPERNPLCRARLSVLESLLDAAPTGDGSRGSPGLPASTVAADPGLGVPGLPQSATGQTTILTGVNGARLMGRHLQAYPGPALRRVLAEHSLFARVLGQGGRAAFLNMFTPEYREALDGALVATGAGGRVRAGAFTLAALIAGVRLRGPEELQVGQAVYHDVTGEAFCGRGPGHRAVTPEEAGRRAAEVASDHDFTLFEYFLTDLAGHRQDMSQAVDVLERLDRFLAGALDRLDLGRSLLIVCSDHGNVEDLAVRTHTLNPVPVALVTARSELRGRLAREIRDLTHLAPAVLAALNTR